MLKLTDRKWEAFRIDDVFKVSTGANLSKKALGTGDIPRITATGQNNGVDCFSGEVEDVSGKKDRNFRCNENCVSVSFLGSAFYQPYRASYDMKIHSLSDTHIDKYTGLFVAAECGRQFSAITYGNQLSKEDLRTKKLLLPVSSPGVPDWEFMSAYMREREQELLAPALAFLRKRLKDSKLTGGNRQPTGWQAFPLADVFTISATKSGIDKVRLVPGEGQTPYVTRSECDNGHSCYVREQPGAATDEAGVITIGLDTQTVFYQPAAFYTGQNIQVLRSPHLTRHSAAFLVPIIKRQLATLNWGGNGATLTRLRHRRLVLPVTASGLPDWAYMEQVMRRHEAEALRKVLGFFSQSVEASSI